MAQHTGASVEAEERGLDDVLAAEFPVSDVDPFLLTALTYCDMTTGPDGSPVDVAERIAEILARYPAGSRGAQVDLAVGPDSAGSGSGDQRDTRNGLNRRRRAGASSAVVRQV